MPGNLKFDAAPPPADAVALDILETHLAGRPRWLAASTHADEEALILAVHREVLAVVPDLVTLIVPRQPSRGAAIAARGEALDLPVRLRSAGQTMDGAGVYVGDTIGELGLFFRVSRTVFVGKSLAGGGGQNPIEPAKLGCAVLHGPLVANFAAVYAMLDAAGGARPVRDAADLATTLAALLGDEARLAAMAEAAARTVGSQAGATARVMDALEPLIRAFAAPPR